MTAPTDFMTLNKRINEWKKLAAESQRRAEKAETDLAKAEASLRNMGRSLAAEKARADRAEAVLRSLGGKIGAAA